MLDKKMDADFEECVRKAVLLSDTLNKKTPFINIDVSYKCVHLKLTAEGWLEIPVKKDGEFSWVFSREYDYVYFKNDEHIFFLTKKGIILLAEKAFGSKQFSKSPELNKLMKVGADIFGYAPPEHSFRIKQ